MAALATALALLQCGCPIQFIADDIKWGPRTIRRDLELLNREPPAPTPTLPSEMLSAIKNLKSMDSLLEFARNLVYEIGAGRVDRQDARNLILACTEMRHVFKRKGRDAPLSDALGIALAEADARDLGIALGGSVRDQTKDSQDEGGDHDEKDNELEGDGDAGARPR